MNPDTTCTSVFKTGDPAPSCEDFTKAWIDLINQMERNKAIVSGSR